MISEYIEELLLRVPKKKKEEKIRKKIIREKNNILSHNV